MRSVDAVEIGAELVPRKWKRWLMVALLAGMVITGNYTPIMWFITAKAAAFQEDVVQPMLQKIVPDTTNSQTQAWP